MLLNTIRLSTGENTVLRLFVYPGVYSIIVLLRNSENKLMLANIITLQRSFNPDKFDADK